MGDDAGVCEKMVLVLVRKKGDVHMYGVCMRSDER